MSFCPICSDRGRRIRNTVRGRKIDQQVNIALYFCGSCDLSFLETWDETQATHDWYSDDGYVFAPDQLRERPLPKFDNYKIYKKEVEPYLCSESRVLDVGCGRGSFLRSIQGNVSHVQGVEITPTHVRTLHAAGIPVWDKPLIDCETELPFDVVVMHAVLEHVPCVKDFLEDLKRFIHPESVVFIAVPNLLDPIASYYDVANYRDFYFREYHLYYFTEKSLGRLLMECGYDFECTHYLAASLTNHFKWLHTGSGDTGSSQHTNLNFPNEFLRKETPRGKIFLDVLEGVDDFYRRQLQEAGVGDLLHCRAWLKP